MDKNELGTAAVKISKYSNQQFADAMDCLAIEEPLEISLAWYGEEKKMQQNISVTMRTPGSDYELAIGFLFTEGILQGIGDVEPAIFPTIGNKTIVQLKKGIVPNLEKLKRNFYTTSSCGVCGKDSIDAVFAQCKMEKQQQRTILQPSILLSLPQKLRTHQSAFERTGGIHASALFDAAGNLEMLAEDVGRHNALDKLIGRALLDNKKFPLAEKILLLSGRASFELVQKAAMAGISTICAIGAPSSLAVQMANDFGIVLIGFLKEDRFNVYGGAGQIDG